MGIRCPEMKEHPCDGVLLFWRTLTLPARLCDLAHVFWPFLLLSFHPLTFTHSLFTSMVSLGFRTVWELPTLFIRRAKKTMAMQMRNAVKYPFIS